MKTGTVTNQQDISSTQLSFEVADKATEVHRVHFESRLYTVKQPCSVSNAQIKFIRPDVRIDA